MNKISLEPNSKPHFIRSIETRVYPCIDEKASFPIAQLKSVTNSNGMCLAKIAKNTKNGDCKILKELLCFCLKNEQYIPPLLPKIKDDGIFKVRNHFSSENNIYSWVAPISYLREINPICYGIIKETLNNSKKICNMAVINMKKLSYLELADFYKNKIGLDVDESDAKVLAEGIVNFNAAVDFFRSKMDEKFIFPRDIDPDKSLASYSGLTKKITIYNSIFKVDSATITHIFLHEILHSIGAKDYFYHRTPELTVTRNNEKLHEFNTVDALNKKVIDLSISARDNFISRKKYYFGKSLYKDLETIKKKLNPNDAHFEFFKIILKDKSKLKEMAFSNADTNAVFIFQLAGFGVVDMKNINQLSKLIKNVDTNSQFLNVADIRSFFDGKGKREGGA
ncbi:hypothetical protein [Pectobacterium versatile]|uniref:hypothetical protein n=1 Tax=Pectobacterium versatile TaxID=2488639 RepID=UPI001CCAC9B5|nr:hypothetical protein [Pectobacterium versatile]